MASLWQLPVVWTIGGSDSGAGAGIQADLKTMAAFGVWGTSVLSAVTAQNTLGVDLIESVSPAMIRAQIHSLEKGLYPQSIKIGMLYKREIAASVLHALDAIEAYLIVDPVLVSTSGHKLHNEDILDFYRKELIPRADLITPNLPEAITLTDCKEPIPKNDDSLPKFVEDLAKELIAMGSKAVLIKGGHGEGQQSNDFYQDKHESFWLSSPRLEVANIHGTGCTLSAALASCIAKGFSVKDALVAAKAYINQSIRGLAELGQGCKPIFHRQVDLSASDLPWLISNQADLGHLKAPAFPKENELGFYPIIDTADKLKVLIDAGVSTVQLRIKNLSGESLEAEIEEATSTARQAKCRLYINDYWQLAIKYHAHGVHLGQEDLQSADLNEIRQSGLRLGISTHCHWELARAHALQASYIAIGPVFDTTTKEMKFAPLGLDGLKYFCQLSSLPTVAIGGINIANGKEVMKCGVHGIALVRELSQSPDPRRLCSTWVELLKTCKA